MAAGKHSSSEVTISVDDAQGGTLRVITSYVTTLSGIKITGNMQASTAFGDTITKMLPTGLGTIGDITLHGFFDDTATLGPHTIFNAPDTSVQGGTRTVTIVIGNSKTFTGEGYLADYEAQAKAGGLTEYNAVLKMISGAWS